MSAAKTLTGAKIQCYINNNLYGRATSVSWESATVHRPIYTIDSADPIELGATITKLSGNITVYRLTGDGGARGMGIVPKYEDVPRGKYFTLTLIDRSNNSIIFESKNCVLQSESWTLSSRSVTVGQLRFEAIDWKNEAN